MNERIRDDFPSVADKLEARLREEDRLIAAKLTAKGWRKRQIENLEAGAEIHEGGGYEEGTQEEYEAFVAKRNESIYDTDPDCRPNKGFGV